MAFDDVEEHVRRRMANTRGRDTKCEMAVRRELHRRGYRYRVNYAPVAGLRRTADIVFTKKKIAMFIDGCFWHGCPEHYRPATGPRAGFWGAKITQNETRDRGTDRVLLEAGWQVLRAWEHETVESTVARLRALLECDR